MKHKRKKKTRMRGSKTHGYGSKKKHRGAGSRGGRGKAGSGKRADTKKPTILKLYGKSYFGKRGFNRPQKIIKNKKIKTINIQDLSRYNQTEIDLTKLGYDKLLGKGNPDRPYKIKIKFFSKLAKEKIEKVGGRIE